MSRIRSTGNKSTELRFRAAMARAGVAGYTVQPDMPERPDLAFLDEKVAVYLDGCFWHGCPQHYKPAKTNRREWRAKILRNQERGNAVLASLAGKGWKVFRVWEHDILDTDTLKGIVLRVARAADTPDVCQFGRPIPRGFARCANMRDHEAIDKWLAQREATLGRQ